MPQLREITSGLRFPEGPVAMADGSILLVEIERRTLTRVAVDGRKEIIAHMGGGPNGAAIGPDGKCYICNNGGFKWIEDEFCLRPVLQAEDYSGGRIERVDLDTGQIELLYVESAAGPLRGPNDLVFDAHGGFYFTDYGKSRERERDWGGIYYARADGSLIREIVHPMLTPNGIGLSPDGARLYVAETDAARLWFWDIVAPGEIRKASWPSPHGGTLVVGVGGQQRFDSLAVDTAGYIAVGTNVFNCGITVVSPDGRDLRHIPLPDFYPTNICFGGTGMRTAFVTLSGKGKLVAFEWERPGMRLNYAR
jgi:gluconolactonase